MYIEYITPQRVANSNFSQHKSNGGEYRPTWLIRVSDWEKVPGHEATNGYCTLSYCWEQSGEKVQSDDEECGAIIDNGLHRITRQEGEKVVIASNVTYDEVLRQICKDFDIEYLWYDKTCIDQTNKTEKHREIKQMHLIYSNARYTVALVPEIHVDDPEKFDHQHWLTTNSVATYTVFEQLLDTLWWKRSWTLEELMTSTRLLIVGRNTHLWTLANQDPALNDIDFLSEDLLGFKDKKLKSANQVLNYAHCRTSSKEHDKIYALTNIFHGIVSIDIDYDSDLSTLMNSFYRELARHDLSVMCFGSSMNGDGQPRYVSTMTSYGLPSWTGAAGLHPTDPVVDITVNSNGDYSIDDDMLLHLKCKSCTIQPFKYDDDTIFYDEERALRAESASKIIINSMDDLNCDEKLALDWSQWNMRDATECLPTHYWRPDQSFSPVVPLSLTEDCEECVILAVIFHIAPETVVREQDGSSNTTHDWYYLSPVVKKVGDRSRYKVIGVALLKHFRYNEPRETPQDFLDETFKNLCTSPKEFLIQ